MSGGWTRSRVVEVCSALGVRDVPVPVWAVAAITGLPEGEAVGLADPAGDRGQRRFLARLVSAAGVEVGREDDDAGALLEHRGLLLAGVRAGREHGLHALACELARRLWSSTAERSVLQDDSGWRRDLASTGEAAALAWENAVALAGLVERSAAVATGVDDLDTAQRQWVRAVALWRACRDEARMVAAMESLIDLYVRWGRLHRALDVAFEMLGEHRGRARDLDVARTLARLGELMARGGRTASAIDYLGQAEQAYTRLAPPRPVEHARVLVRLGRARWVDGAAAGARRDFHRALALAVDADDEFAERVRVLLRADGDLPDED
ncbi:hypothetical protein [Actinokineospora iranica]|uniref:Tetratricopeptide repeat-containing protein n=1 Tax=Actinokineospora iranica TaxID=1271860 RepID=A0A1G6Z3A2_9PSEU|nr:hypothetical protein [Actinokineospora iranica]SDD97244.1 hypothetical protein SAMN05216174_12541 [Actinokineospora iranica]